MCTENVWWLHDDNKKISVIDAIQVAADAFKSSALLLTAIKFVTPD